jgi:tetratricopeptide (TPR) repeat protein
VKPRLAALLILTLLGTGCSGSDPADVRTSKSGASATESDVSVAKAIPVNPDEGFLEALRLLDSGDVQAGAAHVEAVFAEVRQHGIQPDDAKVLTRLQSALLDLNVDQISAMMIVNTTLALASLSGPDVARGPLEKWIKGSENLFAPLLALGHLNLALRDAAQCEASFRRALEVRPNAKEAWRGLGSLFAQTSRMEGALAMLQQALQADPEDGSTHQQLGNVLFQLERRNEALLAWEAAVEFGDSKTRVSVNLQRGTVMMQRGDHETALAVFRSVLEDDPENPASHFNLAQVLNLLDRSGEAREHLVRSIANRPDYSHAHSLLGEIDESAGRHEDALEHYRNALRFEPSNKSARYRLSALLRRQGLDDEADRVTAEIGE